MLTLVGVLLLQNTKIVDLHFLGWKLDRSRALLLVGVLAAAFAIALVGTPAAAQEIPGLGAPAAEPEAPAREIAQTSSPADDRKIEKRLREIFSQVDGVAAVSVEVQAGVIRLSGEVLSARAREKAVRIAGQLQGAFEVQDEIVEVRDVERRLRPVLEGLRERALGLVNTLPLLVVALLVLAFFVLLARLAVSWEAPYRRMTKNPFAQDLLRQAVRLGLFAIGAVFALEVLDATTVVAAVAGIAGVAGLAVSFAFRDLAENYIASVLLSLRQPFLANENVVIEGHAGRVVRLTSRATILIDANGNHVRIPNATVFKGTILNYSRNPLRRFSFVVGVASQTDIGAALGVGVATLRSMPGVVADPEPQAWVEELADWNVGLRFTAWIDQRETAWEKARGEALRVVKLAFDAAGIAMPEPILTVQKAPAPTAADAAPVSRPGSPIELEVDISAEVETDAAIAEERAREGGAESGGDADLLDPDRPRE